MSPPLVLSPECRGGRDVHTTPYTTMPCGTCGGHGMVDSDGSVMDPAIRDAPTLTSCPACSNCIHCGGKRMVTQERAKMIAAAIKSRP